MTSSLSLYRGSVMRNGHFKILTLIRSRYDSLASYVMLLGHLSDVVCSGMMFEEHLEHGLVSKNATSRCINQQ